MKKQLNGIITWCLILAAFMWISNTIVDLLEPSETYSYKVFREDLESDNIKQAAIQMYNPAPTGKLLVLLANGEEY